MSTLRTPSNQIKTTEANSFDIDPFGRKRVSLTAQRSDVEFIYDKFDLLFDEVTNGSGSVAHNSTSGDLTLSVGATGTGNDALIIEHATNPYTPGNGQLIENTGTLNEQNIAGGTAYVFLESPISGVTTEIAQTSWDFDPADINWEFSQIFAIDFQSLKVGTIRFALVRDKLPVLLHSIHNDNRRANPYWRIPSLSKYWQIYDDGAGNTVTEIGYGDNNNNKIGFRYKVPSNATATMRAICGTVKSEGGLELRDLPGLPFAVDTGTSGTTVGNTEIPVLSIRVRDTINSIDNRALIIPTQFGIYTDNPIRYRWIYRPASLTGASWTSVDGRTPSRSGVEYDTSATAFTTDSSSYSFDADYVTTSKNLEIGKTGILDRISLAKGYTGTADILTLVQIRTTTTNASVFNVLKWKEIR